MTEEIKMLEEKRAEMVEWGISNESIDLLIEILKEEYKENLKIGKDWLAGKINLGNSQND